MTLFTPWGEGLDPDNVLQEYPRPQLVRPSYLNLNGWWQYSISASAIELPARWEGEILVPFSPEAPLSGANRQLQPHETLWYRREFTLPAGFVDDRVLLHFGAVDQRCTVSIDGDPVGSHDGGYLPFTIDISDALAASVAREGGQSAVHELVVMVQDVSDTASHSRGKQKLKRGGIWYTAQSGIWQTVWLESVPRAFIERVVLTPVLDEGAVDITVTTAGADEPGSAEAVTVQVYAGDACVATADIAPNTTVRVSLSEVRPWSPEHPFLYDVRATFGGDTVSSYFGMRSFGVGNDESGTPRLLLNGEPYFHAGILDQGYWPDGLYTPPSDDAMISDIQTMKDLGFTMVRKHIKIEPLRWYYHCDRLGLLVWQDMVNGGSAYKPLVITAPVLSPVHFNDWRYRIFGRADAEGRATFLAELRRTVELLRSVTSIAVWVPFNEGWGQFDANAVADELQQLDPTRTIDHASGWHDQGGGDLKSLHVYFTRFRLHRRWKDGRRPIVLSEYGGYSLPIPGHAFNDSEFGYRRYRSGEDLERAFRRLHVDEIVPAIAEGLSGTVYTQLTDVEDELNGLLSYDRRVAKVSADVVRSMNAMLRLGTPRASTADGPPASGSDLGVRQ